MENYVIPLSSAPLRRYLIASALLILLACSIITFFFGYAVSIAPNAQRFLLISLWVGMVAIWLIGWLLAAKNQASKSYILAEEALVIHKKGWLGKGSERLFLYDTIMSVNTLSRAHGSYGSIELILDKQAPITLSGVVLPAEQARRIKKLVSAARS